MSKLNSFKKNQGVYYNKLIRKYKKIVPLLIGIIIGVTTVIVIYGIISDTSVGIDESSIKGGREDLSQREILEELQQATDDSRFRVKINQNPSMDKSTGATNLLIQNSVENKMNKKVIYYDKSGEIVYETYELHPGDDILNAVILGDWQEGVYNLTAVIIAIDKELEDELIVTEMDITLTVK